MRESWTLKSSVPNTRCRLARRSHLSLVKASSRATYRGERQIENNETLSARGISLCKRRHGQLCSARGRVRGSSRWFHPLQPCFEFTSGSVAGGMPKNGSSPDSGLPELPTEQVVGPRSLADRVVDSETGGVRKSKGGPGDEAPTSDRQSHARGPKFTPATAARPSLDPLSKSEVSAMYLDHPATAVRFVWSQFEGRSGPSLSPACVA